ncbi:hypothetical protein ACOQFV_16025 [Nocardiopsis changdeensis]|uniref:Uncharacterized protein n=1 Tax=Nocardiopsis changdeensis TaxID=2831969 RepID=A0ABX8BH56_9ACTN|nr:MULTISPECIES: hypothetical protein [Nocardiopsis]QUX21544.1 hypothetical protein KGD84_24540 [Nocardiopsis changdeensis]QYX37477.1 hypothetical protein K1J57_01910 [Nocardiopsis sp. MT53]
MSGTDGGAVPDPDVEITAGVRADELTFHEVPEVVSRTRTEPDGEGTAGSDRSGVPYGVRTGTVYRDVRVDYRLAARLTDPAGTPEAPAREPEPPPAE